MVQESLTEYINKLLKSGYDVGTIRTTLLRAGYSPTEINQSLTYLKKPTKQFHVNLKTALIGISILIILIILILAGIKIFTPEQKTIEFRISPTEKQINPGQTLSFVTIFASNIDKRENVQINYETANMQTNEILTTKQESLSIGKQTSITQQTPIPKSALPGKYALKATMTHKGKKSTKQFNFNIITKEEQAIPEAIDEKEDILNATGTEEKEEYSIQCPESCDDFNPCTIDYCDKGICRHTPITPCCGNGICEKGETAFNCKEDCSKTFKTPQELITQAATVAKTDPEAASTLCNQLVNPNDVELCFIEVAYAAGRSIICENIKTKTGEDSCYMNFALDGDYSVCFKIKDSYLSKSCNSLKRSETILEKTKELESQISSTQ